MSSGQVRASHILIKHQGSRRKSSWKDPEGRVISATTRDAAVAQLQSLRDDVVSGTAKFDADVRYTILVVLSAILVVFMSYKSSVCSFPAFSCP
ncbi:hypothetical protein RHMOL_Rhmol05G0078400 [Rhododendron molle]|uniref:Uncharacterized protein n=1 Tax=Rhododendron molle TaxID=49168 RepID=A0ACC0NMI9_RHOML|nr:hypothetical protein RHMOL_Rhmol05G0078400 [Rhododendron molle]